MQKNDKAELSLAQLECVAGGCPDTKKEEVEELTEAQKEVIRDSSLLRAVLDGGIEDIMDKLDELPDPIQSI